MRREDGSDDLSALSRVISVYLNTSKVVDRSIGWEWGSGTPLPLSVRFTFKDIGQQDVPLKGVLAAGSDGAAAQSALVNAVTQARNNYNKRAKRASAPLMSEAPSSALKRSRDDCCWGAEIRHGNRSMCDPNFLAQSGGYRFAGKFCSLCRENGIMVSLARVRALSVEAAPHFENTHTASFWSGRGCELSTRFRVVNNTKGPLHPSSPPLAAFASCLVLCLLLDLLIRLLLCLLHCYALPSLCTFV